MSFWKFTCRKKYYLTHPFIWLDDFYRSLKYAAQRAFRGWDDTVIWSIDDYLCEMLPVWLCRLKQDKLGVPMEFSVEDDDEELTQARTAWNAVLDEMIAGFEAGGKITRNELPIHEQAEEMVSHYKEDGSERFYNALDRLGGMDRIRHETEELGIIFNHGMELFHRHFFDLWD